MAAKNTYSEGAVHPRTDIEGTEKVLGYSVIIQ